MGNNARFDQPEMALAAYERWMALEQCEKYRLINKERSDEITANLVEGAMYARAIMEVRTNHPSMLEEQWGVMRVMVHVGDDNSGRVFPVTLEE